MKYFLQNLFCVLLIAVFITPNSCFACSIDTSELKTEQHSCCPAPEDPGCTMCDGVSDMVSLHSCLGMPVSLHDSGVLPNVMALTLPSKVLLYTIVYYTPDVVPYIQSQVSLFLEKKPVYRWIQVIRV